MCRRSRERRALRPPHPWCGLRRRADESSSKDRGLARGRGRRHFGDGRGSGAGRSCPAGRAASFARDLAGPVPATFEWYWPYRLTLDLEAADPFACTPTARELGLRLWHTTQINVPLYSFQTGSEHGTVNKAAHWVVAHSRIRTAVYAGNSAMTHLDPLLAGPAADTMLTTLIPFLRARDSRRGA